MVRRAPARLTIAGTRIVGSRAAVRGMVTPKGRSGQPECRGGMAQHRGAGAVLPGEVEATAVELPEGAQHRWVRVAAPAGAGPLHAVLGIVLARALHRPRADEVAPVTVQDTGCQHIQPDLPALPGQPPLDLRPPFEHGAAASAHAERSTPWQVRGRRARSRRPRRRSAPASDGAAGAPAFGGSHRRRTGRAGHPGHPARCVGLPRRAASARHHVGPREAIAQTLLGVRRRHQDDSQEVHERQRVDGAQQIAHQGSPQAGVLALGVRHAHPQQ